MCKYLVYGRIKNYFILFISFFNTKINLFLLKTLAFSDVQLGKNDSMRAHPDDKFLIFDFTLNIICL